MDVVQCKEENTKRCGKFDGVGECYKSFVAWQNVAKLESYLTQVLQEAKPPWLYCVIGKRRIWIVN
jgi:hypothetical protein